MIVGVMAWFLAAGDFLAVAGLAITRLLTVTNFNLKHNNSKREWAWRCYL
jgi:hypothetical protein